MQFFMIATILILGSNPAIFAQRSKSRSQLQEDVQPQVIVQTIAAREIYEPKVFGGFIESEQNRPAAPEVSGTVDEFLVLPGQQVKRGEVLFLVKPRGLDNEFQHHRVTSPLTGIVSSQLLDVGAFVQPGDAVVQIANPERLTIRFDAALQDVLHLKTGLTAEVVIAEPGVEEKKVRGVVTAVSPASHPELRTYQVYMRLLCKRSCPEPFRLGAFARVIIKENQRKGIRIANLYLHDKGRSVFVVNDDNKLQEIKVQTGKTDGNEIDILAGLQPGMRLVTSYTGKLKDGKEVKVTRLEDERKRLLQDKIPSEP